MANMFEEWNKMYDSKSMKQDVKDAAENAKEFEEIKPGNYVVYIKAMEVKATKAGEPMLAVQLKITEGDCKNRLIFANFMLNKPFLIHKANTFLRALETDIKVDFDNYAQYANMVTDIFNWTEEHEADYDIEYSLRDGKYSEYKVLKGYFN